MEPEHGRSKSLQERLNSLSLTSRSTGGNKIADHVLLGKMIAARPFKRKYLVQIINSVWKTRDRVQAERLTDFIFKFCFTTKEDRDSIYSQRPWSFNGSHMNFKLWNPEVHFHQVKFDTSTFHLQVHGLPPSLLNEDNACMIGSEIGLGVAFSKSMLELRWRAESPLSCMAFGSEQRKKDLSCL